MAKIIITADIHFGYGERLNDISWAMEVITKYARTNQISTILILGDLFHDRVSLRIDVLSEVYRYFQRNSDLKFITFCGNHDMFLKNSWSINSLEPFSKLITVISDVAPIDLETRRFWVLPFIYYENEYLKKLAEIEAEADVEDILLTHVGINGATFNECFLLKNWNNISFANTKFKRVYAGHFHCHQQVGEKVWYPGSPIPFRFDEGMTEHGFFVFDEEKCEHQFIEIFKVCSEFSPHRPPDYITIVDQDLPKAKHMLQGNNVRVILGAEYTSQELDKLRGLLKTMGAATANFTLPKKEIAEVEQNRQQGNLRNSEDIFKSWLEIDQPKLRTALLMKMHQQIVQEAEERYVVTEEEE